MIFYTHSHGDHYCAVNTAALGVRRVYCSETWAGVARTDFAAATAKARVESPDVVPLAVGERIALGNLAFTALPRKPSDVA